MDCKHCSRVPSFNTVFKKEQELYFENHNQLNLAQTGMMLAVEMFSTPQYENSVRCTLYF